MYRSNSCNINVNFLSIFSYLNALVFILPCVKALLSITPLKKQVHASIEIACLICKYSDNYRCDGII